MDKAYSVLQFISAVFDARDAGVPIEELEELLACAIITADNDNEKGSANDPSKRRLLS